MKFINIPYDFKGRKLWKYFDIHKFLYFIQEKKIYFTRLDNFEDPNEGIKERNIYNLYLWDSSVPSDIKDLIDKENYRKNRKKLIEDANYLQKIQFASCWFMGDRESYAMWNLYSNPDSVAVQINPSELINSIKEKVENIPHPFKDLISGAVEYRFVYPPPIDDWSKYIPPQNESPALKKDLSYKHEEEYRFISILDKPNDKICYFELYIEELFTLNFKIITHPKMEEWKFNNVKNILIKYGIEDKLKKSEIRLKTN